MSRGSTPSLPGTPLREQPGPSYGAPAEEDPHATEPPVPPLRFSPTAVRTGARSDLVSPQGVSFRLEDDLTAEDDMTSLEETLAKIERELQEGGVDSRRSAEDVLSFDGPSGDHHLDPLPGDVQAVLSLDETPRARPSAPRAAARTPRDSVDEVAPQVAPRGDVRGIDDSPLVLSLPGSRAGDRVREGSAGSPGQAPAPERNGREAGAESEEEDVLAFGDPPGHTSGKGDVDDDGEEVLAIGEVSTSDRRQRLSFDEAPVHGIDIDSRGGDEVLSFDEGPTRGIEADSGGRDEVLSFDAASTSGAPGSQGGGDEVLSFDDAPTSGAQGSQVGADELLSFDDGPTRSAQADSGGRDEVLSVDEAPTSGATGSQGGGDEVLSFDEAPTSGTTPPAPARTSVPGSPEQLQGAADKSHPAHPTMNGTGSVVVRSTANGLHPGPGPALGGGLGYVRLPDSARVSGGHNPAPAPAPLPAAPPPSKGPAAAAAANGTSPADAPPALKHPLALSTDSTNVLADMLNKANMAKREKGAGKPEKAPRPPSLPLFAIMDGPLPAGGAPPPPPPPGGSPPAQPPPKDGGGEGRGEAMRGEGEGPLEGGGSHSAQKSWYPFQGSAKLPLQLAVLIPPPKSKWNRFLPGTYRGKDGYGDRLYLQGRDCVWWCFWWLVRFRRSDFLQCCLIIACQGVLAYYQPVVTDKLFANLIHVGGTIGQPEGAASGDDAAPDGLELDQWPFTLLDLSVKERVAVLLGVLSGVYYLGNELDYRLCFATPEVGHTFVPQLRHFLLEHYTNLSLAVVERLHEHEMMSLLQDDVDKLERALGAWINTLSNVTMIVCTMVVFVNFNWFITLPVFATLPLIAAYVNHQGPVIADLQTSILEKELFFRKASQELIQQGTTIRCLRQDAICDPILGPKGRELIEQSVRLDALKNVSVRVVDLIQRIALIVIVGVGMALMYGTVRLRGVPGITASEILAIFNTASSLFAGVQQLVNNYRTFQVSAPSVKEVARYIHRSRDIVMAGMAPRPPSNDLSVKDLTIIRQPDSDHPAPTYGEAVLAGCNLDVEAGCHVAVVGPALCGKSTLLKCIAGKYEAQGGAVHIGGREAHESMVSLRDQEAAPFDASVEWNIRLERGTLGKDLVHRAATLACLTATDDAWSLPDGLQTVCGHAGMKITASLKEKVVLARVLSMNSPVVLLDEPFVAQSKREQLELLNHLKGLQYVANHDDPRVFDGSKGSAHWMLRPATMLIACRADQDIMRACDKVAFMEGGRVVEYGAYDELLAREGFLYRFLIRSAAVEMLADGTAVLSPHGLAGSCWLFHGLPEPCLALLSSMLVTRHVPQAERLFTAGEACAAFYIVARGSVREEFMLQAGANRRGTYGVVERQTAEGLCDMPLYARITESAMDDTYPSSAEASTECVVLALAPDALEAAFQQSAELEETIRGTIKKVEEARQPDRLRQAVWPLVAAEEAELEALAARMQVVIGSCKEVLASAEMPLARLCVVVRGSVHVKYADHAACPQSKEARTRVLKEGDVLGTSLLCCHLEEPGPGWGRAAPPEHWGDEVETATCVEEALLLVLDESLFRAWREAFPAADAAIQRLVRKARQCRWVGQLEAMWPFAVSPSPMGHPGSARGLSRDHSAALEVAGGAGEASWEGELAQCWRPKVYNAMAIPRPSSGGFVVAAGQVTALLRDRAGGMQRHVVGPGQVFNFHSTAGLAWDTEIVRLDVAGNAVLLKCVPELFQSMLRHAAGPLRGRLERGVELMRRHMELCAAEALEGALRSVAVTRDMMEGLGTAAYLATWRVLEGGSVKAGEGRLLPGWGALVVFGSLQKCQYSLDLRKTDNDEGEGTRTHTVQALTKGSGSLYMPRAALNVMYGDTPQAHQMEGVHVFDEGEQWTAIGGNGCVLALIDFNRLAKGAGAEEEAVKAQFEEGEKERGRLCSELRSLRGHSRRLKVQLGKEDKMPARWLFRKAMIRIGYMREMGMLAALQESAVQPDTLQTATMSYLQVQLMLVNEEVYHLKQTRAAREQERDRVRAQWLEIGLTDHDWQEALASTAGRMREELSDLCWEAINLLRGKIQERLDGLKGHCLENRHEVMLICQAISRTESGGTGDEAWDAKAVESRAFTLAREASMAALIELEQLVERGRRLLQPHVDDVRSQIAELLEEAEEEDKRVLAPEAPWGMQQLLAAERLLRRLQAVRPGDRGRELGASAKLRGRAQTMALAITRGHLAEERGRAEALAAQVAELERRQGELQARHEALQARQEALQATHREVLDKKRELELAARPSAGGGAEHDMKVARGVMGMAQRREAMNRIKLHWLRYCHREAARGPGRVPLEPCSPQEMLEKRTRLRRAFGLPVPEAEGREEAPAAVRREVQGLLAYEAAWAGMEQYRGCEDVFRDLELEDRRQLLSRAAAQARPSAFDPAGMAAYVEAEGAALRARVGERRAERGELLARGRRAAASIPDLPPDLVPEDPQDPAGPLLVGPARVAELRGRVERVEGWVELQALERRLEGLRKEAKDAEGAHSDVALDALAQVTMEMAEVEEKAGQLEGKHGRVPRKAKAAPKATSKPTSPAAAEDGPPKRKFLQRRSGLQKPAASTKFEKIKSPRPQ